ncbi:MAG: hypothetical protein AAFN77_22570 [Planctomycetota bacterium]
MPIQDKFEFLMEQRRKFLKEMTALTGFALITGAELCRAEPVGISGDPFNDDKDWGSIKGRVVLDGDAPQRSEVDLDKFKIDPKDLKWFKQEGPILSEDWVVNKENKGVQWLIVWLIPENADTDRKAVLDVHEKFKAPIEGDDKFVIVDQEPQGYVPHAVAIREGMGLKMRNQGPVAHVFNLTGFKNQMAAQNMAPKAELDVVDLKAERITNQVTCPPHPWERMWLKIFDHPYYAVTDKDGNFEIKNAPKGKCRLVVWQETIGYKGGRKGRYGEIIEIEGGASTDLGEIKIEVTTTKDEEKKG